MEIAHDIDHRHQVVLEIVGDLPGRAAVRVARKCAVEVAVVERADPRPGDRGRRVQGRDHDQPAADIFGLHLLDQPGQHHLTFVFVTVVAGGQQDPRAVAIVETAIGTGMTP